MTALYREKHTDRGQHAAGVPHLCVQSVFSISLRLNFLSSHQDMAKGYQCVCQPGFVGRHCEVQRNLCSSSPCKNGGQCHALLDHFLCQCLQGFTGATCEVSSPWSVGRVFQNWRLHLLWGHFQFSVFTPWRCRMILVGQTPVTTRPSVSAGWMIFTAAVQMSMRAKPVQNWRTIVRPTHVLVKSMFTYLRLFLDVSDFCSPRLLFISLSQ